MAIESSCEISFFQRTELCLQFEANKANDLSLYILKVKRNDMLIQPKCPVTVNK